MRLDRAIDMATTSLEDLYEEYVDDPDEKDYAAEIKEAIDLLYAFYNVMSNLAPFLVEMPFENQG